MFQIPLKRKYLQVRHGKFGAVGDHQHKKRQRTITPNPGEHRQMMLVLFDGRRRGWIEVSE